MREGHFEGFQSKEFNITRLIVFYRNPFPIFAKLFSVISVVERKKIQLYIRFVVILAIPCKKNQKNPAQQCSKIKNWQKQKIKET